MRIIACACLAALAACSTDPIGRPGTPGAGVATEIVGIDHDSTGYTVRFRMTNHDTGGVGYGACTGAVQVPTPGGWQSVTNWGQCTLQLLSLPPETPMIFSIPRQTLAPGSQIRVAVGWSFVYPAARGVRQTLSTTEPVAVP